MATFRKNDIVTLPAGTSLARHITESELQTWADSDASKGMNCAGETKLAPRGRVRDAKPGETFTILRARAVNRIGWREILGCTLLKSDDGFEYFVKRTSLRQLEA